MSRATLAALAMAALAVPLSGCSTLLKDEEPFKVQVFSEMADPWTGTIVVGEEGGDEVFRKTLTITRTSLRTPYHLPELDGRFTFAVEAEGQRWEDTRAMTPGTASWTIRVSASQVCFDFLDDGAGDSVCPAPNG